MTAPAAGDTDPARRPEPWINREPYPEAGSPPAGWPATTPGPEWEPVGYVVEDDSHVVTLPPGTVLEVPEARTVLDALGAAARSLTVAASRPAPPRAHAPFAGTSTARTTRRRANRAAAASRRANRRTR